MILYSSKRRFAQKPKPLNKPIYITLPILPNLEELSNKFEEIRETGWLANNTPQNQALDETPLSELGVPYPSLFNNGTIALIIACRSLRLTSSIIYTST